MLSTSAAPSPSSSAASASAAPRRWAAELWIPLGLLLIGAVAELVAILALNGGRLVYTLDDPYIHLAVAEELARGGYGVNTGELSAPASSILWPFLLAPLARTALAGWVPLAYALASLAGAVLVIRRVAWGAFEGLPDGERGWAAGWAGAGALMASGPFFLLFSGMEHPLQLFLAALVTWGLIEEGRTGRAPGWLLGAVVLSPLVRYEGLAVAVPALLYLALRRHLARAAAAALAVAAAMGGFTAWLLAHGLPPLPASVLVKGGALTYRPGLGTLARHAVLENFNSIPGRTLALFALLLAAAALGRRRPRAERLFAAYAGGCVALHLVLGRFGWMGRYEAYAWTVAVLALLHLYRAPLAAAAAGAGRARVTGAAAALLLVLSPRSLYSTLATPRAANNIHVQHGQMHRFATDYWRAPVAVNDLGRVAFRNDAYVLDLWGLGSAEALRARFAGRGPAWMERMAAARGAELAMVYDAWFPELPPGWRRVGVLRFDTRLVTPAEREVAFYARGPRAAARADTLLRVFAPTLPPGARIVFPAPGAAR
ncbi:MAG TPA: hypothetical protein VHG91_16960 [Longimicrobium sp.]|nr:hypothetical protein [Longimicrobium sp.]